MADLIEAASEAASLVGLVSGQAEAVEALQGVELDGAAPCFSTKQTMNSADQSLHALQGAGHSRGGPLLYV